MKLFVSDIVPKRAAVLSNQGFPDNATVKERIQKLLEEAFEIFLQNAEPSGLLSGVSIAEFEEIFLGSGRNAPNTPLQQVFPRADKLAFFALTIGNKISAKINDCFSRNDFVLGSFLDSVASLAADKATEALEEHFACSNSNEENTSREYTVLSYSPGYCGWHLSGQKKLFQFLRPKRIGISLNDSFLMTPLKSVTGVLVGGKKEIHIFKSNYPFCDYCKDRFCIERMKKLKSL
jgi:hypothetical protein